MRSIAVLGGMRPEARSVVPLVLPRSRSWRRVPANSMTAWYCDTNAAWIWSSFNELRPIRTGDRSKVLSRTDPSCVLTTRMRRPTATGPSVSASRECGESPAYLRHQLFTRLSCGCFRRRASLRGAYALRTHRRAPHECLLCRHHAGVWRRARAGYSRALFARGAHGPRSAGDRLRRPDGCTDRSGDVRVAGGHVARAGVERAPGPPVAGVRDVRRARCCGARRARAGGPTTADFAPVVGLRHRPGATPLQRRRRGPGLRARPRTQLDGGP